MNQYDDILADLSAGEAQAEADALRPVHAALEALAAKAARPLPEIDVLPGVLAVIDTDGPEAHADTVALLLETGDAWRAALPGAALFAGHDLDALLETADLEASLHAAGAMPSAVKTVDLLEGLRDRLPMDDEASVEPELEAALFALGGAYSAQLPAVELWAAVQDRLPAENMADNVVAFPAQPAYAPARRRSGASVPAWLKGFAGAAAAVLLFSAGYSYRAGWGAPSAPPLANHATPNRHAPGIDAENATQLAAAGALEEPRPGFRLRPSLAEPPGPRAQPETEARPVTLKEVVGSYRLAMQNDAAALGQLAAWASLTREEAAALLGQAGVSGDAVIGAAQFLSPEEALAVLQAAVDNAPEDPYLRFALASRLEETNNVEGYRRALDEWRQSDPGNALPHYLEAQMLFASGAGASGVAAVHAGASLSSANLYASRSASYHAAALEASGYDRDTARFLAASTAGSNEYDLLRGIGDEMMAQAQRYEAAGDYGAAADLYDAARVFGEQVMIAADVPNAQLAAYEIQQDAVSAMLAIQELWTPETLAALTGMADTVMSGLTGLTQLLSDMGSLLGGDSMTHAVQYTDAVLSGDISRIWQLSAPR